MDMPTEHNVRCETLNPTPQILVADEFLPAPGYRGTCRRGMMDPDPPSANGLGSLGQLAFQLGPGQRAIPPRAYRHQPARQWHAIPVHEKALRLALSEPQRDGLVSG